MGAAFLFALALSGVAPAEAQTRTPGDVAATTYACRTEATILDVVATVHDFEAFTTTLRGFFRDGSCSAARMSLPVALARYVGEFEGASGPGEIWELTSGWYVLLRPSGVAREEEPSIVGADAAV